MTGLTVYAPDLPSGFFSSLSLLLTMATVVPIGLVFTPQAVRRDKRVIVGLILALGFVIGVPAYAVVCNICDICKGSYWWLIADCWFL